MTITIERTATADVPVARGPVSGSCSHWPIIIVGGGTAGLAVAAALRRSLPRGPAIALLEPNEVHHYQPGFTLVGGGVWPLCRTRRWTSAYVPAGVHRITTRAASFDPDHNRLTLANGQRLSYDFLVACPGLELQWQRVPGLAEALGRGRVCSIYAPDSAADTWARLAALQRGTALFTQPEMPIKCPGAPQKIVYLAADHWRRQRRLSQLRVRFATAAPTLFSVPEYVPTLERVARGYGVEVSYCTRLLAVDDATRCATLERTDNDGQVKQWTERYDLLHAVPPQGPVEAVRASPLADGGGWIDVDPETLQQRRYRNVFGLGDATSVPTSKTAAAVRAQVPVVAANLAAALRGDELPLRYSGYASCPLITGYGRVVLAEFVYGREVQPSLPWDSTRERRSAWWLKTRLLPWMYWNRLLRGTDLPLVRRT